MVITCTNKLEYTSEKMTILLVIGSLSCARPVTVVLPGMMPSTNPVPFTVAIATFLIVKTTSTCDGPPLHVIC